MIESKSENTLLLKVKTYLSSRNTLKNLAGFALGAVGGFIYYKTIGCSTGSCAITSNPYMSILWGGLLGYLLADIFKLKEKDSAAAKQEQTEA
ncbi:MAG: hypothetical protein IPH20_00320 [Bacteroidales bacterium]|nr:hypothetical protein [Bacteroidales bacterium]